MFLYERIQAMLKKNPSTTDSEIAAAFGIPEHAAKLAKRFAVTHAA